MFLLNFKEKSFIIKKNIERYICLDISQMHVITPNLFPYLIFVIKDCKVTILLPAFSNTEDCNKKSSYAL